MSYNQIYRSPHKKSKSSDTDRMREFTRAVKALRGSTIPLTLPNIAKRAALHLPEGYSALLNALKALTGPQLEEIGYLEAAKTGPPATARPNRLSNIGNWSLGRSRAR